MVKHVYCAPFAQYKITVDSLIRIYCFNNWLTSRVYFKECACLLIINYLCRSEIIKAISVKDCVQLFEKVLNVVNFLKA